MAEICNGRLSYTDPNFTKQDATQITENFKNALQQSETERCTVVIDWLSVLFKIEDRKIPEPPAEMAEFSHVVNDRITLQFYGKGTEHYRYIWFVIVAGEHLATMLSHTRNAKFVRNGVVKVDFKNHLLYSEQLWPVYSELVHSLDLQYKNVSRLDIALDGLNYLVDFMNLYVKQTAQTKVVELKGHPRFNSKVLDRKSMKYQNFQIGAPGSKKVITIYNKSLDIVITRKEYIQEFWKQNGILQQMLPIEMLAKAMAGTIDRTAIEGYQNIYRFEIRLKGEAISQIEKFNIGILQSTSGLISIVKLMVRNFFEAVWLTDTNISRCEEIQLIPFDQFEIVPLAKIALLQRDDLYKTKLSINKNIRQLYTGHLSPENASVYEMLQFDIDQFRLQKWFREKYTKEWKPKYSKLNPDHAHVANVDMLISQLFEVLAPDESIELQEDLF